MMTAGNTAYSQCPIVAPVPNDACYQQVIAADSWCCNNAWDGICQAAYDACNPPAGCAVVAPVPNDACYQTVIAADSWCCDNAWDATCQAAYVACMLPPPCPVVAPVPNDACYQQVIAADSWCCNNSWDAVCQAAYDACNPGGGGGPCASITPLIGCGAAVSATMTGTGAGWDITNCGFNTPGTESIFSFTATSSGIHSLDITTTSGGFVDFFWIDAATGCSAAGPWNCIGSVGVPGNYGSMNWVAGQTYYILLDPEGTGSYTFVFDVNCPNGGPVTASDCSSAIPVCTNLSFSIDPNGFGLVDELCTGCVSNPSTNPTSANFGCLNSGELNSTWFTVNVAAGGTLDFSFGAPLGNINCFDWIMWPYDATTCNDIIANTLPPVTCNWNSPCAGFTGVGSIPPPGGDPGNFEPTMNVSTGDQYLICFSNYSSALTSVPLSFTGSSDISCTLLPVEILNFSGVGKEGYNKLDWSTGAEVNNAYFAIESSEDGVVFEKIGEVQGAGTSLTVNEYSFNDYLARSGVTYYRLKQVDFNEEYKYTGTIAVSGKVNTHFKVLSAYPNPTDHKFNVQLLMSDSDKVQLSIAEPNGTIVESFGRECNEGNNLIEIPVSHYSKGMYFVKILNERTQASELIKLVVQ